MINVLPQDEKKELKREYYIRLVSTYFFCFGVLAVLVTVLLLPTYMVSDSEESFLKNEFSVLENEDSGLSLGELQKNISDINNQLAILDGSERDSVIGGVINDFLFLDKNNIKINKIFYTKTNEGVKNIEINGIAKDRVSLSNFKTSLEKSGFYEGVDLPISNFIEKADIVFNIKLKIK